MSRLRQYYWDAFISIDRRVQLRDLISILADIGSAFDAVDAITIYFLLRYDIVYRAIHSIEHYLL